MRKKGEIFAQIKRVCLAIRRTKRPFQRTVERAKLNGSFYLADATVGVVAVSLSVFKVSFSGRGDFTLGGSFCGFLQIFFIDSASD